MSNSSPKESLETPFSTVNPPLSMRSSSKQINKKILYQLSIFEIPLRHGNIFTVQKILNQGSLMQTHLSVSSLARSSSLNFNPYCYFTLKSAPPAGSLQEKKSMLLLNMQDRSKYHLHSVRLIVLQANYRKKILEYIFIEVNLILKPSPLPFGTTKRRI